MTASEQLGQQLGRELGGELGWEPGLDRWFVDEPEGETDLDPVELQSCRIHLSTADRDGSRIHWAPRPRPSSFRSRSGRNLARGPRVGRELQVALATERPHHAETRTAEPRDARPWNRRESEPQKTGSDQGVVDLPEIVVRQRVPIIVSLRNCGIGCGIFI